MIATTSSEKKSKKVKELGADHVINYRTDPNWGETARKLTPDAAGVDHIIEVGGPGTMQQSFNCIKYEGVISVIGFLGGVMAQDQPALLDTLSNICTVRGVYVGSKALMRDMIRAIEANDIHPVVDEKVFTLDQAREAYEYMVSRMMPFYSVIYLPNGIVGTKAFWKVDYQGPLRDDVSLKRGEWLGGASCTFRGKVLPDCDARDRISIKSLFYKFSSCPM